MNPEDVGIDQSEIITLKVYNTAGQTVKTFFESTVLASGSYNINLLGDSLVNGVYIINLKIGSTKNLTVKVVKNSSTTGISDQHVDQNRLIYPNPTTDEITIDIKGEKTIILTDLNGKIVKSLTTAQKVISVLDLTAGSYFLTVFNKKNEVLVSKKIIKTE